ncbi:hypothetical protein EJ06DRAFT_480977 [Trichodelitschia bisporula]|uniref:Calcineurin-like phosphoesterase domain-containing protein n=1 Tax=Trichodelitschia bisporula TaxID=703511 RepID=A0A6G1HPP9_9PEZI|nr:hypothetical protein EJ06DRAFT_480977 [Trichodelitschia bisporula]
MQPEALTAVTSPRAPLEWGQINFLQTTDTHGWLEGHLKERNYGADWGDYVSFVSGMKEKAKRLGVDLLLIDTGDLHDGAGLSDVTTPNGLVSNPIWENIDYDVLTIGNHELYLSDIAYSHFTQFTGVYGDRYVNSNVEIYNTTSKKYERVGSQYRYFTTPGGIRIMAFGVLFDFTGNSNASRITMAANMVKQHWFAQAVNFTKPIDLFLVIGHNPPRDVASSTIKIVYAAIRKIKPDTPIQVFGGHSHVRDFVVYDNKATGFQAGRYCETLGWLALSGLNSSNTHSKAKLSDVPTPTRSAVVVATGTTAANYSLSKSPSNLTYARRYLDWNRRTFEYHVTGSQAHTFDIQQGKAATAQITGLRQQLNLSTLYGCAPKSYCQFCKPYGSDGNILTLLEIALGKTIANATRKDIPRYIIVNTGSVRFDLVQGPFTLDDSYIVSPFKNEWWFIPDVPYTIASQVLSIINKQKALKRKRDLSSSDFGFNPMHQVDQEICVDPPVVYDRLGKRSISGPRLTRRQDVVSAGYTTTDDFGTDGDDTAHSSIPNYPQPNNVWGNASFPTDGSVPKTVDLVFLNFAANLTLQGLQMLGASYTLKDVINYLPSNVTSNMYLPEYAKIAWQANMPNCPVGAGIA